MSGGPDPVPDPATGQASEQASEQATGELDDFLDKWRGRWPEWRIAQAFVPEPERPVAEAWFALLQEWTDAAWAGEDPTPGFAKLGWWQEELLGWARGGRRHPLGRVLQKRRPAAVPVRWELLAAALPALRAVREPLRAWTAPAVLSPGLQPLAGVIAAVEDALFAPAGDAATAADTSTRSGTRDAGMDDADATALLAAHVLWHREDAAEAARARDWARRLDGIAPVRAASRPRRIHDALVRARLARVAAGRDAAALPPLAALWHGWRGARG